MVIYRSCPADGENRREKSRKSCSERKKGLTKRVGCDNIYGLPDEAKASAGRDQKEIRKTRKKFLTKRITCDNIKWLCDERRKPGARLTSKKNLKKLEKSS